MKTLKTLSVSTLALVTAALLAGGCTDSGSDSPGQGVGNVGMRLTTASGLGAGFCMNSDLDIARTDVTGSYTMPADPECDDLSLNVPFLAGDYLIDEDQAITCVPPNNGNQANYVSCEITSDVTFTVTEGGAQNVSVPITFHYLDQSVDVVFSVGEVNISVGTTTVLADMCGTTGTGGASAEICDDPGTETCYILNGGTPACYLECTADANCAEGEDCVLVVTNAQIGVPMTTALPRVCMDLTPAP